MKSRATSGGIIVWIGTILLFLANLVFYRNSTLVGDRMEGFLNILYLLAQAALLVASIALLRWRLLRRGKVEANVKTAIGSSQVMIWLLRTRPLLLLGICSAIQGLYRISSTIAVEDRSNGVGKYASFIAGSIMLIVHAFYFSDRKMYQLEVSSGGDREVLYRGAGKSRQWTRASNVSASIVGLWAGLMINCWTYISHVFLVLLGSDFRLVENLLSASLFGGPILVWVLGLGSWKSLKDNENEEAKEHRETFQWETLPGRIVGFVGFMALGALFFASVGHWVPL